MVELVDNLCQTFVALLGGMFSGLAYCKSKKQTSFLLACFYGCFALGGLYWTLYFFLFSETPQISYVSETGWISSYLFLYILQYALADSQERNFRCWSMWLCPLLGICLLVFYCTYGDILVNVIVGVMITLVAWCATRGFVYAGRQRDSRRDLRQFHAVVLCIVILEQCLWIASCFWISDTMTNPYFWFDFLLTAALFALLPATKKAVGL